VIIGLNGQARSGKDTVADFLVEHYGFVKVALADPIKRAAMEWWDFTEEQLWGDLKEEPDERYPVPHRLVSQGGRVAKCAACGWDTEGADKQCYLTPRHALQQVGTEVGRLIDGDVWVRYTMGIAETLLKTKATYIKSKGIRGSILGRAGAKGVVISDCRFKNEFAAIREAGGQLTRIIRPKAGLEGEKAQHASEAEQREVPDDYFDFIIHNVSTPHELRLSVDSMMGALNGLMKQYDANGDDDVPPFKRT
jgi:hypothetical protein